LGTAILEKKEKINFPLFFSLSSISSTINRVILLFLNSKK
jgi:hypothetical protein